MESSKRAAQLEVRIAARLRRLYGERSADCHDRLRGLIAFHRSSLRRSTASSALWDQTSSVLITYGDTVRSPHELPLRTLERFLDRYLRGAVDLVHVLPFCPSSSDDGFSVIDYRAVDPALGSWDDLRRLGRRFGLMFDLVLNHASRQSRWFESYLAGTPPHDGFFLEASPDDDLSTVVRPRSSPLLTPVETARGQRHVWTTFSDDQIDLDYGNPALLLELLEVFLRYLSFGARVVRLDAVAYLWKELGTSCIHLPQTHEVVKLLRDVADLVAPGTLILTETNVPHRENISYFGDGDEAHAVYQFSLPPLLLHALHSGDARYLNDWAGALPTLGPTCTFLNFTASHDGVGVRPLEGLLPRAELTRLIEATRVRGGRVSLKRDADGRDSPYELNITYFDALGMPGEPPALHVARFLCSQTVALSLRGIPAIYLHSLTATSNDLEGVAASGRARSINRRRWDEFELRRRLATPASTAHQVFFEYRRRLRCRARHPAFHPDASQELMDAGDALFVITRRAPSGGEVVLAVHNLSPHHVALPAALTAQLERRRWSDLLTAEEGDDVTSLAPYQCRWLSHRSERT